MRQNIIHLSWVAIILFFSSCGSRQDKKEIGLIFEKTKQGLVEQDGLKVYESINRESIAYYERLLKRAQKFQITGDLIEKASIVRALMLYSDDRLEQVDVKEFIVDFYDESVKDENTVQAIENLELEDLAIQATRAQALLPTGIKITFDKEDDGWKTNLMTFIHFAEQRTSASQQQAGLSDREVIEILLLENVEMIKNSKRSLEALNTILNNNP